MELLRSVVDKYNWLFGDLRDPRVDSFPMMSSPFPTIAVCLTYALIVTKIGPTFMKDRKPFQLRKTIIIYNAIQVIFSSWLFWEFGQSGWFTGYSYKCQPVDYTLAPMAVRMAEACWWYYFSKFTEFFDTFFFVLRKKDNQVSALHVIHHGIMPMSVWFGVRFTPGGHSTFFILLNTFVHIIMYFYYMMAAMGPQFQKYLWWKKYLTKFQILQFVGIAAHSFQLLFIDCKYPKAFVIWIGGHGCLFLVLFAKFYKQAYLAKKAAMERKTKEREEAQALEDENNNKNSGGFAHAQEMEHGRRRIFHEHQQKH